MSKVLRKLQKDRSAAQDALRDLEAKNDSGEHGKAVRALRESIYNLNQQIRVEQELIDEEMNMQLPGSARIGGGPSAGTGGFESFGEFASSLVSVTRGRHDGRLIGAVTPSTYGNEGVGADGGFLVPPQFSREIWALANGEAAFLPLTDNNQIETNSMTFPSDETTPWGTDGIRIYWENEAAEANKTKPKITPNTLRMNKLMGVVPVTDELMEDAPALGAYLERKVGELIRFKVNDAIINGSGVGRPKGIMNSGAVVSVAKETSQTADTVTADNVAKMIARLPAGSLSRAVWVIHSDVLPQLITMTVGNTPIWTPPNGGLRDAPAGFLLGRPIMISQTAQPLGDQGDIALIDFGSYRTITKAGGIETATSIHVWFDSGVTAFRVQFRIDGGPMLSKPIAQNNGGGQQSPFVVLAERA